MKEDEILLNYLQHYRRVNRDDSRSCFFEARMNADRVHVLLLVKSADKENASSHPNYFFLVNFSHE